MLKHCLLCFVLPGLFFLSSCKPSSKAVADGKIHLSFWHIMNYAGPREVIEDAVRRFEADYPHCKVDLQTFENDAYKTKLAVEEASGNTPDIFFTWGGGPLVERAKAGRLVNLKDWYKDNDWEERFIGQALDFCRWENGVYALPLDLSAVLLWCNQRLFQEHGIDYPDSFPALLEACQGFRQRKITPFALGNMKQWPGAFFFCYLANRCGGTKLFLDAANQQGDASFDDPAFIQAGVHLQEMIAADAFSTGFNGMDEAPARAAFLRGDAAMYLMGTWLVARIIEEKPEFLQQLQVIPFPAVSAGEGDPSSVLGGINCAFAVSASCKHPELASKLLEYLTSEQVVTQWCQIGRLPALHSSPEQEEKLPNVTRLALRKLREAESLQPYYDQYLKPRLAVEHKKTTQHLFSGTMTPQQAAQKMAQTAKQ